LFPTLLLYVCVLTPSCDGVFFALRPAAPGLVSLNTRFNSRLADWRLLWRVAQYPNLLPRRETLNDSEEVRQDYLSLRDTISSLQIATLGSEQMPEASYAPFVWHDNACYLFLSDLAKHTRNLKLNPSISVMMIEDEAKSRNKFARRRIVLQGSVQMIDREQDLFETVLIEFRARFGEVMKLLEPLQDFHLFQITPGSGRFIRGFGQAYAIAGEDFDELVHINPGQ
jgi:putative heme iron utilization protein